MRKIQSQGVHHITLVGADRQTSIDFWEGVLGMPFVFEQPNLDRATESHLYFDPGDGRLITVFTDEGRKPDPARTSTDMGCVHHVAFSVSRVTFLQAVKRLDERCQRLLRVVAFQQRPDYASLALLLDMPMGSIGPTRSRCLGKLRTMITSDEGSQR